MSASLLQRPTAWCALVVVPRVLHLHARSVGEARPHRCPPRVLRERALVPEVAAVDVRLTRTCVRVGADDGVTPNALKSPSAKCSSPRACL